MRVAILILAVLPLATCFSFRGYRAVEEKCPLKSCMDTKIDLDAALESKVNVERNRNGFRVTFEKDIFSFSCSVFGMFKTCMNDLNSEELDTCYSAEEQPIVSRLISLVDKSVCTKAKRFDKLVPCMNSATVQKVFFEDLLFTGLEFMNVVSRNGSLPCQELKTTYLTTVAKLSIQCDNDGLLAILEMFSEVATELRDTIAPELGQAGISIENVCFDVLMEATTTAKNSLSNQDAYLKCIQGLP
ncbi:uncharacterized protein [Magallana gigas]|uniref:uncharacterized protein isoform X1 n=1 Tax=Magallana gigas TaxID=29159 RepID=UPI00334232BA